MQMSRGKISVFHLAAKFESFQVYLGLLHEFFFSRKFCTVYGACYDHIDMYLEHEPL
jgi:hypothetical protein